MVVVLAALAGCQAGKLPSATVSPLASKPPTGLRASTQPSGTPSAAVSAVPQGPRRLQRPVGAVRVLAGSVAIDVGYAAGVTGGRVVSNNGSTVFSLGSPDLGSGLIGDGGGSAELIASQDAALIGKLRGTSGLLGGAELIGKIRYQLAQAAEPRPELGQILPSAGMAVRVLGLATGKFLPIGTDPDGKPVFEVLSDADGRFEVFLPAAEAGTVLVVARPPLSDDPRLLYQLAASSGTVPEAVTEESSRATDFVKLGVARAMFRWVSGAPGLPKDAVTLSEAEVTAINASRERLRAAGTAHTASLPEAERAALAVRLAEIALSGIDLAAIPVARQTAVGAYDGPEESAFSAFAAILGRYREQTTAAMRAIAAQGQDPFAVLSSRPYFTRANVGRSVPYSLRKPMDYVDFVVERFIATDDPLGSLMSPDFQDAGHDVGLGDFASVQRMGAALTGTKAAIDRAMYLGDGQILSALLTAIEQADPTARPAP